jgi:signal peptidase I
MGDNRDNSGDSRYFGFVKRESIVGKALAIVISLNYDKSSMPRWERTFTKLP